jgi:predicted Abi (CAAX) family protease
MTSLLFGAALVPTPEAPRQGWKDVVERLLEFLYSIAHYLGLVVVRLLDAIVPGTGNLDTLVDPIGVLCVLTIFVAVAEVARKLVWSILLVGWILIVVRLVWIIVSG